MAPGKRDTERVPLRRSGLSGRSDKEVFGMSLACLILMLAVVGGERPESPATHIPGAAIDQPDEIWQIRFSDAIQIGLENHETVRVMSLRQPIPIANCFGDSAATRNYMVMSVGFPMTRLILMDNRHCRIDRRGSP